MSNSRTKNVSKNVVFGLIFQIVNLLVSFASRTVFIKVLGAEYLGVNGLFTNVLTVLSFAELGIGNAIIFSMYKPLAQKDEEKLGSLMALYQTAYRRIGVMVAVVGICVIPFLNVFIKEQPKIPENIAMLYVLYLLNTVISYFFVYKKSIIIADQKNYIVVAVTELVHVVQVIVQILILYATHNYVLFLLLTILFTFLTNFVSSLLADRLYPFLKKRAKPLCRREKQFIFSNVRALAVYKFGSVVLNGTDNILVSALIGVREVGLVSNYVLLHTSCNAILGKIAESFTASVGNLNAVGNEKAKYDVFNSILFITSWLYGFASVGLAVVSQSFITAWIGPDYVLDRVTVLAIVFGFYIQGVHFAAYTYRTTLGYFKQGKIAPLVAVALNIALSVLFCKWIGLAGIFIATPIARIFTTGVVDPVLIYKRTFHKNPLIYYIKHISYLFLFCVLGTLCHYTASAIPFQGITGVLLKAAAVTVLFNGAMCLCFCKTKVFRDLITRIRHIAGKGGRHNGK